MNLSLGRLAGILLLAFVLVGCSKQPPGEPLRTAADDSLAEHALKHTNPKYRCPMHPDIIRDEPGVCPICGMTLVRIEPPQEAGANPAAASRKPLYYRNPMDPNRRSPVPAKDEMGMDYVPVYAEDVGGEVRISPAVMNNLGVRTEPVVRGSLPRRGDVVGYVQFDERRVQQVRPRAEGWVEGLSVRAMGETVQAGQLLFTLYSPMLESVQQEYLDALKIGNPELIDASRDRLRAVGLDAGTAARLAKSGRAAGRVSFYAPISGVITELEAREGVMLTPEMSAMTITELGSLWVVAEVPESQSSWVRQGTHAEVRFPSQPGQPIQGRVEYVYPELNMETRTVRARIVLDAPPQDVRPNMLATVSLMAVDGAAVLHVPRSAVIRNGTRDRVVVALGDGRFSSRNVVAGAEAGDRIAIREGLQEGDRVVVAAQFLLDSEANLGAGLDRLDDGSTAPAPAAQPDPNASH
ncbi:MAG: efflux RND transporter periplasmic adaptor subunit [Steroidobacteraceae bacterium]